MPDLLPHVTLTSHSHGLTHTNLRARERESSGEKIILKNSNFKYTIMHNYSIYLCFQITN